jgi:methylmalonyl-CoA mutase C-terminal domain/subunit
MKKIKALIAVLGMDQHEVGAVAVSRLLRDAGMEVIYLGRFNTPAGIVKAGIEEAADVIGLSCHSWEYLHFMPELLEILHKKELDTPIVVGGSVITPGDKEKLKKMGVAAVFGPSATNEEIIEGIHRSVKASY